MADDSSAVGSTATLMDEGRIEELLSEKLMHGFLLMERVCPRCVTPLVKQEVGHGLRFKKQCDINAPVPGVPFCVSCRAHIMTDEADIVRIQRHFHGQALQGRILIDFQKDPDKLHSLIDDDETVDTEASSVSSPEMVDGQKTNTTKDGHNPHINVLETNEVELVKSQSNAGKETPMSLGSPVHDVAADEISDAESLVASMVESFEDQEDNHEGRDTSAPDVTTPSAYSKTSSPDSKTISKARTGLTKATENSTPTSEMSMTPGSTISKTVVKAASPSTASIHSSQASPYSTTSDDSSRSERDGDDGSDETSENQHPKGWPNFEERKLIATKVLSVKMLQGHKLLQKQCRNCSMPMTEFKGAVSCAVCPVIQRRVSKANEDDRKIKENGIQDNRTAVQKNKNQFFENAKNRLGASKGEAFDTTGPHEPLSSDTQTRGKNHSIPNDHSFTGEEDNTMVENQLPQTTGPPGVRPEINDTGVEGRATKSFGPTSMFVAGQHPVAPNVVGNRFLCASGGNRMSANNSILASDPESVNASLLSKASSRPSEARRRNISNLGPNIAKPYLKRTFEPALGKESKTADVVTKGRPARPVMGISKVMPQPSQDTTNTPALVKNRQQTPNANSSDEKPETKTPSDENSTKISSVHSDSTISSKTKVFFRETGFEALRFRGMHKRPGLKPLQTCPDDDEEGRDDDKAYSYEQSSSTHQPEADAPTSLHGNTAADRERAKDLATECVQDQEQDVWANNNEEYPVSPGIEGEEEEGQEQQLPVAEERNIPVVAGIPVEDAENVFVVADDVEQGVETTESEYERTRDDLNATESTQEDRIMNQDVDILNPTVGDADDIEDPSCLETNPQLSENFDLTNREKGIGKDKNVSGEGAKVVSTDGGNSTGGIQRQDSDKENGGQEMSSDLQNSYTAAEAGSEHNGEVEEPSDEFGDIPYQQSSLSQSTALRNGTLGHFHMPGMLAGSPTFSPYGGINQLQINNDLRKTHLGAFESRRQVASKEIGKRMSEGWIILNSSCPQCSTPLMADTMGQNEICVMCGPIGGEENDTNDRESSAVSVAQSDSTLYTASSYASAMKRAPMDPGVVESFDESISEQASDMQTYLKSTSSMMGNNHQRNSARAMSSAASKKSDSRMDNESVPSDPPAMQGYTLRRREAQDCDPVTKSIKREIHAFQSLSSDARKKDPSEKLRKARPDAPRDPESAVEMREHPSTNESRTKTDMVESQRKLAAEQDDVRRDPYDISHQRSPQSAIVEPWGTSDAQDLAEHESERSREEPPALEQTESDADSEVAVSRDRVRQPFDNEHFAGDSVSVNESDTKKTRTHTGALDQEPSSPMSTGTVRHEAGKIIVEGAEENEVFTLAIPAGFDVNNEIALRQLIAAAKRGIPLNVNTDLHHDELHLHRAASPGLSAARAPRFPLSDGKSMSGATVDTTSQPSERFAYSPSSSKARARITPENMTRSRGSTKTAKTTASTSKFSGFTPEQPLSVRSSSAVVKRGQMTRLASFSENTETTHSLASETEGHSNVSPTMRRGGNQRFPTSPSENNSIDDQYESNSTDAGSEHSSSSSGSSSYEEEKALHRTRRSHPIGHGMSELSSRSNTTSSEVYSALNHKKPLNSQYNASSGGSSMTPIYVGSDTMKPRLNYSVRPEASHSPETIIILDEVIEEEPELVTTPSVSETPSVTSEAIDALLNRIEETQAQLAAAGNEVDSQAKRENLARLLGQLSAAAAAVEELDETYSIYTEEGN